MDFKPREYKNSLDLINAERRFAEIDHPVRCRFRGLDYDYDILPFVCYQGIGIGAVLLRGIDELQLRQGEMLDIDHEYFEQMESCEPIEVNDFDWRSYLDEKTA